MSKSMRVLSLMLALALGVALAGQARPALAYSASFDGFADGTAAGISFSGSSGGGWQLGFDPALDDGPINPNPGATALVYCRSNGIEVVRIRGDQGFAAFLATPDEIARVGVPAVNTLIDSGQEVRLYRLTTGEFQINAPGGEPGKEYVFIWPGCSTFTVPSAPTGSLPSTAVTTCVTTGILYGSSVYIVQPGDTLSKIARRFGVSMTLLASVNNILNVNRIEAGQVLIIPGATTLCCSLPVVTTTGSRIHVVQPGENLFRIGLRYGVPLSTLAALNCIANINLIYAGQQLVIP